MRIRATRPWRYQSKYFSIVAMLAALLLCADLRALADDQPAFLLSRLSVADELLDMFTEDLNADSLSDILIVHKKGLPPKETRWISIFWQSAQGGFSTAANQSWELDTSAVILDIGDVTGDTRKEICYLTSDEVRYYPINGNAYELLPRALFKVRGMTVIPAKRRAPLLNFVRDWNQDGKDEVGVFEFSGLTIYASNTENKFAPSDSVPIRLESGMQRVTDEREDARGALTSGLVARFTFPDLRLVDFDNDGLNDIIATMEDRVRVYRRGRDGKFTARAGDDILFDVRTQQEKIEGEAELQTVVTDLNNDGYADALVTKQTNKGLSNFRGVINLFWGRANGYPAVPDQVIISEGTASSRTYIRDINADGRQDLILPSVKISITAIIRMLITRNLPIAFNIFLMGADGRFPEQPDFTKEVKLKIDWSGESDSQAMDLDGDYNGDQRKDFVFATEEDVLAIYLGVAGDDELFSKRPVAEVTADAFGELSSPDLNNDGYSDMIIYYPQSKERKGVVEVLMNQRRLK